MENVLEKLKIKFPLYLKELEHVLRLRKNLDIIPFEEFFESVALVSMEEKKNVLGTLDVDSLTGWTGHIYNSSRVRMRNLENSYFSELHAGRFLSCMVLLRAHMESAALAAYAQEKLMESNEKNNWEPMREIIVKMLFGSALKLEKKNENLQKILEFSASEPVRIRHMIISMDKFLQPFTGSKGYDCQVQYALLCEYAHPTMRVNLNFSNLQRECNEGWFHLYGYEENFSRVGCVEA